MKYKWNKNLLVVVRCSTLIWATTGVKVDDILNAAELDLFTIIARAPFKLMKYPGKLTDSNEIPKRPLVAPSPYLTLNVASFLKRALLSLTSTYNL